MPNLILSTQNEDLSLENFNKILNLLNTQKEKYINIIGERDPLLNNNFLEILKILINDFFKIQIFTEGTDDTNLINDLKNILNTEIKGEDQLYFGLKLKENYIKNKKFLEEFGRASFIIFTIYDVIDLEFIVDIVKEYNMTKFITLEIPFPIAGEKNSKFLELDKYEIVSKKIMKLLDSLEDIEIGFNCGFPLCMFSLKDIEKLNSYSSTMYICSNQINIYPNLNVTNCSVLKNVYTKNLNDFNNTEQLSNDFHKRFVPFRGIYKECTNCVYFLKFCSGGCRGFYEKGDN
jgi:radical SAM protein with 4Fe4S-binding SPASM domain